LPGEFACRGEKERKKKPAPRRLIDTQAVFGKIAGGGGKALEPQAPLVVALKKECGYSPRASFSAFIGKMPKKKKKEEKKKNTASRLRARRGRFSFRRQGKKKKGRGGCYDHDVAETLARAEGRKREMLLLSSYCRSARGMHLKKKEKRNYFTVVHERTSHRVRKNWGQREGKHELAPIPEFSKPSGFFRDEERKKDP